MQAVEHLRHPSPEATPPGRPLGPVDALILDEARQTPDGQQLVPGEAPSSLGGDGPILVLDAPDLARHLLGAGHRVLHRSLLVADEADLPAPTEWTDPDLAEVELVLMRLPTALDGLDEYAWRLARHCHRHVRLVAGARVKHMTRTMNDVLARHFDQVWASRGRQKSRVLHATGAHAPPAEGATVSADRWPRSTTHPQLGLTVVAHGATFAGNRLDPGTALLVEALGQRLDRGPGTAAAAALDLGCGSGILTALLARAGWHTTGLDTSRAAVDSTRATLAANHLPAQVVRADITRSPRPLIEPGPGAAAEAAQVELIACNPPFHDGAAKDSSAAFAMFEFGGQVVARGGEFWCVFNAHLPYLPALRRHIGTTRIAARDRHYIVTHSVRA